MKNLMILALAVFLAVGMTACSAESQATPNTTEKPATVKNDGATQLPAGHPPIDADPGDKAAAAAAGCPAMGDMAATKAPAGGCSGCLSDKAPATAAAEKDDCCGTCGGTAVADKAPEKAAGCGSDCAGQCGGDECKGDGSCDACQESKKVDN